MTLASSLALMGALFLFCAAPGPGVMAVTARSLLSGPRTALPMALGMTLGDLAYFTCAVFGLAMLARSMGELFVLVKLAGGGYCVWIGLQAWRARPEEDEGLVPRANSAWRGFGHGFLICLSNPKVILFYLGFLPAFVDLQALSAGELFAIGAMVAVVIGGTLCGYVLLAHQARRFLRRPRSLKIANRISGTVLIGAGVAVALE